MKFNSKKSLENTDNIDRHNELKRKERRLILDIRRKSEYEIDEFYVDDKDLEKLIDLRESFKKLVETRETKKAYEKIVDYTKALYEISGVFDKISSTTKDEDYDEYEEFDDLENIKQTLINKTSYELEFNLYKDVNNDSKKTKKINKEDEFERLKRREIYIVLSMREENKQYTKYINEDDVIRLTKLHLDCLDLVKNDTRRNAHTKIMEYTKELGLVVGLYSKNDINKDFVLELINNNAMKLESSLYNVETENKVTLECINKDTKKHKLKNKFKRKHKSKNKDDVTSKCCMIM